MINKDEKGLNACGKDNEPKKSERTEVKGTAPKASGNTSFGCSSENTANRFDSGFDKKVTADENTATTLDTSGSITINPPMSYGWICPKCGRVNAPWKDHCDCDRSIGEYDGIPKWPMPNTPTIPYDPYTPYKWGDQPGWWMQGPMCINYCAHMPRNN